MSKSDGFCLINRIDNTRVKTLERIKNFNEFYTYLDDDKRNEQAARCMNCGVPMCQSAIKLAGMVTGCPLHNYIPEWNDALYNHQFDMAAWRLLKTSSFPEFTGRVCPALCEKACNCGSINSDIQPVTIHENELYIIEKAFSSGYIKPEIPKNRSGKKIAVIGSGPAGLAVANTLNKRGHNVTVFERDDRLGGLLMYGIPNMKLDKKIIQRRIDLMKEEGIVFYTNFNISKDNQHETLKDFDAIALCCGAKQPRKLNVSGENSKGVLFAVDFLKSITKSLLSSNLQDKNFFDVKDKNVIIVGGGDTGNDCTGTCIRLGAKNVTQIEMMKCPPTERQQNNPWPQWPKVLKTDYGAQEAIEVYGHDPRIYETTIKEIQEVDGKVVSVITVNVEFKEIDGKFKLCQIPGSEKELKADLVLIAAGFTGCEKYVTDTFNVELSQRNTVLTKSESEYQVNNSNIFSAGDMHRGQSLVVWAINEGQECAHEIDKFLMGYTNE